MADPECMLLVSCDSESESEIYVNLSDSGEGLLDDLDTSESDTSGSSEG